MTFVRGAMTGILLVAFMGQTAAEFPAGPENEPPSVDARRGAIAPAAELHLTRSKDLPSSTRCARAMGGSRHRGMFL
jgi:hypothetical protein